MSPPEPPQSSSSDEPSAAAACKKAKVGGGGSPPPPLASSLSSISPSLALVPPGKCQFTPEFSSVPLLERHAASSSSSLLRFGLPDSDEPLGLSTCACILAKADLPKANEEGKGDDDEGGAGETEAVIRPYTPISTNEQVGCFDLLVKHYDNGRMSKHLRSLPVGATLEFKHIDFNVKIQAPFPQKRIGMLVGGTGITPMIQALHAILGGDEDKEGVCGSKASMLYGSKVESDILGRELLDRWSAAGSESGERRFDVTHVLSDEPPDSEWKGERGYISRALVEKHMPGPELGDDAILFVCGPPPMYNALCGPRDEKVLSGLLKDMGYKADQVYKF